MLKSNFDIHERPEFEVINYIINDFTEVNDLVINTKHTQIYTLTDDMIFDTKGNL